MAKPTKSKPPKQAVAKKKAAPVPVKAKAPAKVVPAKAKVPSKPVPAKAPVAVHRRMGGLGRGLDALIGGASAVTAAGAVSPALKTGNTEPIQGVLRTDDAPAGDPAKQVLRVPVAQVHPSPWQPRHEFNDESLEELAASIRSHGVIQPLVCRRLRPKHYELIAGERRLRAASIAGLGEVPVVLLEAEDRAAAEMALIENLQREDLSAIEEAEGYKALQETFGLTQQVVADRVGKARASVANALRLLELSDELKQMLGAGAISVGHAKLLLSLDNEDERLRFARLTVQEDWTVRALEKKIRQAQNPTPKREILSDLPPDYVGLLLERFHARFGTSVHITPSVRFANGRRGKGRIEIEYYGNEDLDRLLPLFGIDVNAD